MQAVFDFGELGDLVFSVGVSFPQVQKSWTLHAKHLQRRQTGTERRREAGVRNDCRKERFANEVEEKAGKRDERESVFVCFHTPGPAGEGS